MPLTTDPKLMDLSRTAIEAFDKVDGGVHPGYRPAHAKGILLTGIFTPSKDAADLTRAPHIQQSSTSVLVRLSDFAGVPNIPDNDPNASPRGCAIRFQLGEHVHTDIVAHSVDMFPARTAEDFLEFLNALIATDFKGPHPNAIEQFLSTHPAALAFVQAPKPFPTSFARESFFAISAFKFSNQQGLSKYGRYRILPAAGSEYLTDAQAAAKDANYLFDELKDRITKEHVKYNIVLQLANAGDTVDDATVRWPEDRPQVAFGELSLTSIAPDNAAQQQQIIFDPIPRVDGIEASKDPLFEPRANVYLLAGRRRRAGATAIP
jgi:catalase